MALVACSPPETPSIRRVYSHTYKLTSPQIPISRVEAKPCMQVLAATREREKSQSHPAPCLTLKGEASVSHDTTTKGLDWDIRRLLLNSYLDQSRFLPAASLLVWRAQSPSPIFIPAVDPRVGLHGRLRCRASVGGALQVREEDDCRSDAESGHRDGSSGTTGKRISSLAILYDATF